MTRSAAFRVTLVALATVLCVFAFVQFFDARQVIRLIAHSNRADLWIGASITAITINLRAIRLGYCVEGRLFSPLLFMAYLYNALSALLPARLGDMALPFLLRKQVSTPLSSGFGFLILLRVIDLLSLAVVGALFTMIAEYGVHQPVFLAALLICAGGSVVLLVCVVAAPSLLRFVERHGTSHKKLWRVAAQVALPMARMRRLRLVWLISLSFAIWISLFASFALLARSIMAGVALAQVGVAGSAASLAFAVPVSAIANVGSFEAAWVWAMSAFGHPAATALAAALLVHGVIFAVSMVFGVAGYAMMMRTKGQ